MLIIACDYGSVASRSDLFQKFRACFGEEIIFREMDPCLTAAQYSVSGRWIVKPHLTAVEEGNFSVSFGAKMLADHSPRLKIVASDIGYSFDSFPVSGFLYDAVV